VHYELAVVAQAARPYYRLGAESKHPNGNTALTLIPQHYPATTNKRCDTLRKGRIINPPPPRPYSQQHTSLQNSNRLLTLLENSVLILQ